VKALAAATSIGLLVLATSCSAPRQKNTGTLPYGNRERGEAIVRQVGCGACHEIPQIRTARGLVGPPLLHMGRRTTIAGVLPNTPENMIRWVQNPQSVVPGNAMPNMGLSAQEARDVAAYLEGL
jgi:cytochrome c1